MGASRRFRRRRGREVTTSERKHFLKDYRKVQQAELERRQAEADRIVAEYQTELELEAGVRAAFAAGFTFAWMAQIAQTPGVAECTA